MTLPLFLFIVVVVVLLIALSRRPHPLNRIRKPRVVRIPNPVLGTLNLIGPSANALLEEDLQQIREYFSEIRQTEDVAPLCDVLLLYCEIDSSGAIKGSPVRLREIIRNASAVIVVVATDNPLENSMAAYEEAPYGDANLMMTTDRKGPLLGAFLARLFEQMQRGVSMPIAWHNISPQIPGLKRDDLPESLCVLDFGQVTFE